jgi:hypothetical protein
VKSPFPGMDPYLEAHWRDVHQRLVIYSCDILQPALPRDLRARVEERVFVESPLGAQRAVYPDVRVIERPRRKVPAETRPGGRAAGAATAEPLIIHLEDEPVTEGYVEIIEVGSGGRVVSVIEFLSLSNKLPGEGQDLYLQKQREMFSGGVSLVEIDLLRAGRRILAVPEERLPASYRTPYRTCVHRSWQGKAYEVYRLPLRERLPVVNVPLRETDPDVALDLQLLIEKCYENGAYDDLDYGREPDPPLEPEDAAWADALLLEQGRRR